MLVNQDKIKEEFKIPSITEARRHTDKMGFMKEETKNLFSDLEPVDEELDYTKGNELAQGSVGVCYNALNNASGKVIIVKTLDFSELDKDEVEERVEYLEKNIEMVKDILHENIINYITVIDNNKHVDVIMEYVPGGSLRFILNNFVKFKEKLVRSYTKQIVEGLKSLHEKSIIHGDLKCSNLLIDDLGIVKISDFGFIKQVFNDTRKMKSISQMLMNDEYEKHYGFVDK